MANEIEFEMTMRAQFLEQLKQTVPVMENLKKVTEEFLAKERNVGREFSDSLMKTEKLAVKEFEVRKRQIDQAKEMSAMIEKVNSVSASGAAASAKSLSSLKANEEEIKKIYAELEKLDQKGQELINNVASAADAGDTARIENLMNTFKEGLDPEQAKAFEQGVEEGMNNVATAIERPTRELRELKRQITAGELEGEALDKAIKRAAELEDNIGDVSARIKNLSSDTFAIDALSSAAEGAAGGFAIMEGAAALFGGTSEELQQTLLKVNSAMAILQGIQAVQKTLLEESAAKTAIYTAAEKLKGLVIDATTGKIKAANVAMLATVGGAVIAGIVLLIANWEKLKNAIGGVSEEQQLYRDVQKKAIETAGEEIASLDVRLAMISKLNVGDKERTDQIKDLQKEYPSYLGNLDAEKTNTEGLTKAVTKLKDAYLLEAQIKAAQDKIAENFKKKLDNETQAIEDNLTTAQTAQVGLDLLISGAVWSFKNAADNAVKTNKERNAAIDKENELLIGIVTDGNNKLKELGGNPSDDKEKEEERARIAKAAEEERARIAKAAREKRLAAEKKAQEEQLQNRKSFNDSLNDLFQEAQQSEIDSLTGEEKLLALLAFQDEQLAIQEDTLRKELALADFGAEEKLAKEQAITDQFTQLRADAAREANNELVKLRAEDAAKKAQQDEESLQREEELLIAREETRLNNIRGTFKTEEDFQRAKEQAILNIQLEFAQKQLSLLTGTLTAEQELQKANLEKTISELKNQVEDSIKASQTQTASTGDSFLMTLFGVGQNDLGELKSALGQFAGETLNFFSSINEANIRTSEARISQLDKEISEQEKAVDKQKELQEKGLANDVKGEEKRLSEIRKQRAQAALEQEKLRKREVLLDSLSQASSLATAAAKLFSANAWQGPAAVISSIAQIGAILAFMVRLRSQLKGTVQLRKGASGTKTGIVTGASHEQGGERFTDHIEVEGGEIWGVLNKSASMKHGNAFHRLVESMNKGAEPPVYRRPAFYNIIEDPAYEEMKKGGNRYIEAMANELHELKEMVRNMSEELARRPKTWTEGEFTVVQVGNKTRRFRLRKDD